MGSDTSIFLLIEQHVNVGVEGLYNPDYAVNYAPILNNNEIKLFTILRLK